MSSKKIRPKLYADENFPVSSATFLKSLGISIVHAYDHKMINKSDLAHIKYAAKLERTLITIDRDFLYYSAVNAKNSFGAIVISTGDATPNHISLICKKALPKISEKISKGAFIRITMSKIIVKKIDTKVEINY